MARRKKGRPVHGWLIIDKPSGVSSTQVVGKARWALDAQKAGHAGALDPLATGALPIAFGEATKTVPYVMEGDKGYRFTVRWGQATATDDSEGEVIAMSDSRPTDAEIEAVLPNFVGDILQVPPKYSSIRVEGERAYNIMRAGDDVEIEARPLYMDSLELIERPDPDTAVFDMVCGKGGYVRSIARDLGEALGCFGHIIALRRLWTGPFEVKDGISLEFLETLRHNPESEACLLSAAAGLDDIPALTVDDAAAAHLFQGRAIPATGLVLSYGDAAWADHNGRPAAIGVVKAGMFHPSRVFNYQ